MKTRINTLYKAITDVVVMDDIDKANLMDTLYEVSDDMLTELENIYVVKEA